jgi:purine-nucleoside/S-methyl-5'-thioadenosine phosphorylase / adenosine deaminase
MEWRQSEGVRWLQADLGGARAAFSSRLGGVSESPFDSLNLGLLTDDVPAAVAENRRRLAVALGLPPGRIAYGRQVHGAELATHTRLDPPFRGSFATHGVSEEPRKSGQSEIPEVDGHIVGEAGLAALVFTADCLPVALSGPGGVAMLHGGWRGLAAGIVAAGAAAVGATDAAIGPGIGPCCYEVGDEVFEAFSHLGDGIAAADGPKSRAGVDASARRRLDLAEVARRLLRDAGVERIESAGLCTSCERELFFSHRRDAGRTGRQGGLVWIEPGDA